MVKKFKACFCACGKMQLEGIDFFETYAPVVQCTTIRLMFILYRNGGMETEIGTTTMIWLGVETFF